MSDEVEDTQQEQQVSEQQHQTQEPSQTTESQQQDLQSMLPEDLRNNPSLQDFKDVSSLAKSYVNAQSLIGKSVRIPSNEASEEQLNEFYEDLKKVPNVARVDDPDDVYTKLGRPESPDQYRIEAAEEDELDPNVIDSFKKTAHNLGLNNEQVNKLVEFEKNRTESYQQSLEQYQQNAVKELREKWGSDFENRLNGAKQALQQYKEKFPEYAEEIENGTNPFANNPIIVEALSEIHKMMQEKGAVSPQSGVQYGTSAEEAKQQINDIRGNPKHPYNDTKNPAHKQEVEKVNKLYKIAYGE